MRRSVLALCIILVLLPLCAFQKIPCFSGEALTESLESKEETPGFFGEYEVEEYTLRIEADPNVFPEDVRVDIVKEDQISSGDQLAESLVLSQIPEEKRIERIATFSITFYSGEEEIQPEEGNVRVSISLSEKELEVLDERSEISVYHIGEEGKAEEVACTLEPEGVVFEAESFSYYSVVILEDIEPTLQPIPLVREGVPEEVYSTGDDNPALVNAGDFGSSYVIPNLPPLKSQGSYGICWAFNTLAGVKTNTILKNIMEKPDFSELQLAYSVYHDPIDPLGGLSGDHNQATGNFMKIGGNNDMAGNTLAAWQGATAESDIPYSEAESVLANGLDPARIQNAKIRVQDFYIANTKTDRESIKRLLKEVGAVSILFYSGSRSLYSATYNSYYNGEAGAVNHALAIVGWDDAFPKEHFINEAPGDGAWLVRNSWATGYEESYNGYFWLSYYEASLDANGYAFNTESVDTYTHNYQYDGCVVSGFTHASTETRVSNVFTAKGSTDGEILKAASVQTGDANVSYQIRIYKNLKDKNNPESGVLSYEDHGFFSYEGYHTVPLMQEISLEYGNTFSVVFYLTHEGSGAYVAWEKGYDQGGIVITPSILPGQSFIKLNGAWKDFSTLNHENLRIKAFTTDQNRIHYTIRFLGNGGTGESWSYKNRISGKVYTMPKNRFTKKGYKFSSWNRRADGTGASYLPGSKVSDLTKKDGSTVNFYAKWTPIQYSVRFSPNGGTGKVKTYTKRIYGKIYTIPKSKPKRSGYRFLGWNTGKKATKAKYVSGQKIKNLTTKNKATVDLYAVWKKK